MPLLEVSADATGGAGVGAVALPAPGPQKVAECGHGASPGSSALNCTPYFSEFGLSVKQGTLRSLAGQFAGLPGVLSFSGGFPPAHLFPFSGLTLHTPGGASIDISDPGEMGAAQQYNFSLQGYAPLLAWAQAHVAAVHAPPPAAAHQLLITNGGNHTLEMLTSLLLERGDSLLLEEYTYPVMTESFAAPKGYTPLAVPIDGEGIVPERLEQLLAELAARPPGALPRFPKLLYTVPVGQNPTGCTISAARRDRVYRLCQRYGLLLIEDDPYYYLRYPQSPDAVPGLHGLAAAGGSYLSIDTDGRVIRVDTFAKFFAPGMRIGWVTAHPQIVEKLTCLIQAHTVGPCSLSQVVVASTLAAWGPEGLHAHLQRVQREYAQRAQRMLAAAEQHLRGLAVWEEPHAGMFLWVKLLGVEDASDIWEELKAAKVVVLPGRATHCRAADPSFRSPYVRISFSSASEQATDEGLRRLGAVLRARST